MFLFSNVLTDSIRDEATGPDLLHSKTNLDDEKHSLALNSNQLNGHAAVIIAPEAFDLCEYSTIICDRNQEVSSSNLIIVMAIIEL